MSRGFTLIEILVVLLLIGMLAGIGLPRLVDVAQRFEWSNQRLQLQDDVSTLGYQAYRAGRNMILDGSERPDAPVLPIPPGWRLEVGAPIHFHFSGVCGGGRLRVFSPDGKVENWQLPAPFCKPQVVQGVP